MSMIPEQKEARASERYLGVNSLHGRLYDIVQVQDLLFHHKDSELVNRVTRVCTNSLRAIQAELQAIEEKLYFKAVYGGGEAVAKDDEKAF
jgi:hypothetical protein